MGAVTAFVIIRNSSRFAGEAGRGCSRVDTGANGQSRPETALGGHRPQAPKPSGRTCWRKAVKWNGHCRRQDRTHGEVVGATVLFGDENTEPLLGVTALESLSIEVDPLNQQLKKLRSVRTDEPGVRDREVGTGMGENQRWRNYHE